jgi:hypothetical protein
MDQFPRGTPASDRYSIFLSHIEARKNPVTWRSHPHHQLPVGKTRRVGMKDILFIANKNPGTRPGPPEVPFYSATISSQWNTSPQNITCTPEGSRWSWSRQATPRGQLSGNTLSLSLRLNPNPMRIFLLVSSLLAAPFSILLIVKREIPALLARSATLIIRFSLTSRKRL